MYTKILSLAKSYRFRAFIEIFLNFIAKSSPFILIMAMGALILDRLDIFLIVFGLIVLFNIGLSLWSKDYILKWSQEATDKISNDYLSAIYKNYSWSKRKESFVDVLSGDIIAIRKLSVFYQEIIPQFTEMFLYYLIILVFSIKNRTFIFLIVPIAILLMLGLNLVVKNLQKKVNKRRDRRYLNMNKKFMEDLLAMTTILMYGADDKFQTSFDERAEKHRSDIMSSLSISLPRSAGRIIIANIAIIIVCIFLLDLNIQRINLIDILLLLFSNTYILLLTKKFAYANKQVHSLRPVLTRITDYIENASDEKKDEVHSQKTISSIDSLEINDLNFAYDAENVIFKDANLKIEKGILYSLIGENGAGKSSLVDLIRKKYIPQSGDIKLNGISLSQIDSDSLTSQIAILQKDNFIFTGSIKDNLLLANKHGLSFEEIENLLKHYKLLDFVESLSDKFDSQAGENGNLLSFGQRQQLAFAMLVLQDKSIYILDEATSSVNPENSKIILNALKILSKDKLVINITHKKADILMADKLIFLNKGKLILGDKESLLENEDYRKLYARIEEEEND